MCGRFNLRATPADLVEMFALLRAPDLEPRYNIAPTQPVAAVRQTDGGRELSLLRWGLVPSWADDLSIGARMINARADTVATKPSFRSAFRQRRCLIPATGFYEWKPAGDGTKQPYHIGMQDGRPFAFAGLWERWDKGETGAIESCTIITTEANELLADVHQRMPVILRAEDYQRWLESRQDDRAELEALLVPYAAREMKYYPINKLVNNPRNETVACLEPVAD